MLNRLLCSVFCLPLSLLAQHDHHKNEIGIANSLVYFAKEEAFAYGLHSHFVRRLGESRFGIGLGYERIFDEHKHSTYGIVFAYTILGGWNFNASPGITIEAADPNPVFALHLETSYEFELGTNFHIGPVLEFAYDPEDIHLSAGLHVGFGF